MISDTIFQLLKEKHMTQKEFSERTGIPQGTISDWKRKKLNPSADKLPSICNVLGISADVLIGTAYCDYSVQDKSFSLTDNEILFIEAFRTLDSEQQRRLFAYADSIKSSSVANTDTDIIAETDSPDYQFTRQKALALHLRKLARLGRLRLDESEHSNGRNLHLLKYLDYVGLDKLEYIRKYLANIQPFMITEFQNQETFDHAVCVLDNYYRISVYIKINTQKEEEIVVSFHENHKNGIAKRNPETIKDEYIYVIPDSIGSKSGETYTINLFITRGVRTFPVNVPASRFDEDGFIVRYIYINNALIDICNRYLEELYTADLDFSQIEIFSSLSQLSFTSYGNDIFSNISLLVDSILLQKNIIEKQVADSALCMYCSSLTLSSKQKIDLLETLAERYKVNSIRVLPEIINRIEINLN